MLKRMFLLVVMATMLGVFSENTVKANGITIDYFYDQLAPYGHWENVAPFGWVWQPNTMTPGWKPYSDGYWVYSSYGWTYQADNEWAWAVYHYGRWTFDDYLGWLWVPGSEWAPAWVAWRNDGNYVGWAALPPQAVWDNGGFHARFNMDVDIPWSNWCFVDNDHFDSPRVSIFIENSARNITFIRRSHNITHYEYRDNHFYNRCIDVNDWERARHRTINRYDIIDVDRSNQVRISSSRRQINVYRPRFESSRAVGEPRDRGSRGESNWKYNRDRNKYDKHYDKAYYDLIEKQKREDEQKEEIRRQHDDERNAYREQRNRDTRALENRHVNELDRNTKKKDENRRVENNNSNNERRSQSTTGSSSDKQNTPKATDDKSNTRRQSTDGNGSSTDQNNSRRR